MTGKELNKKAEEIYYKHALPLCFNKDEEEEVAKRLIVVMTNRGGVTAKDWRFLAKAIYDRIPERGHLLGGLEWTLVRNFLIRQFEAKEVPYV